MLTFIENNNYFFFFQNIEGNEGAHMCRSLGGLLSTLALKMDQIEHDLVSEYFLFLVF